MQPDIDQSGSPTVNRFGFGWSQSKSTNFISGIVSVIIN
uniref:Uncharacterized protein n=1 Tax=Klebsiella pneumoniae TaxID=573 RepID=A0A6M6A0X8_KLEPN|nr:hypothetical protein [Klebsiella pneumoniae]QLG02348.1 hypothetical protein [Klebsiella pneumoniae]